MEKLFYSSTEISRPSNINVKCVSLHYLNVSWKKASGNPDKYRVKCQQEADPEKMNSYDTEGPDISSLRIEDLEPGMKYKVSVVSVLRRVESPEEPPGGIRVSLGEYNMYIQLSTNIFQNGCKV